jgi:nucleotide-binding universal stress UspA family protein
MNIVLAIDSSPSSEVTIREVVARPWPGGVRFCVLHVVDLFILPPGGKLFAAELEASESLVKSAADRLAASGLSAVTAVTKGYPPSNIVDYAEEWGADFVVVGSRGFSGVKRFLMGSIAQAVVRHAPCSVEVVRARSETLGAKKGRRILLATDGSECSDAATRSIAARPWPAGSEVKVLSVVYYADPLIDEWKEIPHDIAGIERELSKQREKDTLAARTIIENAGLKVTSSVLTGYPKSVILDQAKEWNADLIVVGAHGRRGLSRLFLGSVSEAVAIHAHCSVEVIRVHPSKSYED